jgi:hypothetical protein
MVPVVQAVGAHPRAPEHSRDEAPRLAVWPLSGDLARGPQGGGCTSGQHLDEAEGGQVATACHHHRQGQQHRDNGILESCVRAVELQAAAAAAAAKLSSTQADKRKFSRSAEQL